METSIQMRSNELLKKKLLIKLAFNAVLAVLGISSLFIKFFLVDGVLAFRAFTVDGNLYTMLVSVFSLVVVIRDIFRKEESNSKLLYYLKLCSAVTEAVIFIVVMIGYLPFFADEPAITPYHMFCLHVAIPILSVLDFILLQRPIGFLKPANILIGGIPIAVYGVGVTLAIKLKILPIDLVPYSFLDFEKNFLWYVLFALIIIVCFGYFWSWIFYRLNLRSSTKWYRHNDIMAIQQEREESQSRFDVVNTSLLLGNALSALVLMMITLLMVSRALSSVQKTYINMIQESQLDVLQLSISPDDWELRDGALYKGDVFVGDGSRENQNAACAASKMEDVWFAFFSRSDKLSGDNSPEWSYSIVSDGFPEKISGFDHLPILSSQVAEKLMAYPNHAYSEEIVLNGEEFFCLYKGLNQEDNNLPMVVGCSIVRTNDIVQYAKSAEFTLDYLLGVAILLIFGVLFVLSIRWIRTLEVSLEYLKALAIGEIPDTPFSLHRRGRRTKHLEEQINHLAEVRKEKDASKTE